jgi:hypothetical protein
VLLLNPRVLLVLLLNPRVLLVLLLEPLCARHLLLVVLRLVVHHLPQGLPSVLSNVREKD